MPPLASLNLPPPSRWQDFEDLCLDLWRQLWDDPEAQKNGRNGQPQAGIDVYGRLSRGQEWAGVQCKLRAGPDYLSRKDLEEAVQQARSFEPPLRQFVLATTSPRDATLQEIAREITTANLEEGSFTVTIAAWDDIVQDLSTYPEVAAKHFQQFFSHSPLSLLRWTEVQARAKRYMLDCLESLGYQRTWDVRKVISTSSLFVEEPNPEAVAAMGPQRPLVTTSSSLFFAGDSGQGTSWLLYRLGYELTEEGQVAVLIQGTGAVESDIDAASAVFCREILGVSSLHSLRDLVDQMRRDLPKVEEPWLTILIDGVKEDEYAITLHEHPWQRLGLRVAVACRSSERLTKANLHAVTAESFSIAELSAYFNTRLGIAWVNPPNDVRDHLRVPLFAQVFCDLQGRGTLWKSVNEYQLFERVWSSKTAGAPLAASAVAGLAARLPEEQVYPWPLTKVWAMGLRDGDIQVLVNSGLLRLVSGGRSLEVFRDRILNWAVAEGLVSGLRSGDITMETLVARAIPAQPESLLHSRLNYIAMDTLWLLTTREFGLDDAVREFLAALRERWDDTILSRILPTLGERIVPHLFSELAGNIGTGEEE